MCHVAVGRGRGCRVAGNIRGWLPARASNRCAPRSRHRRPPPTTGGTGVVGWWGGGVVEWWSGVGEEVRATRAHDRVRVRVRGRVRRVVAVAVAVAFVRF